MEAPNSPRELSPPAVVISPALAQLSNRKRKHAAISSTVASSPAPSDPGATPTPGAENVVLTSRHTDLSTRPRLDISRHPVFVPLYPGSSYFSTEPLCNNRLNFRYTPAGLTPVGSLVPFRTIETVPTCSRVSWEDRSPFVRVTQDGLGLKGEKGFRSARCNAPIREGKWYMEIKVEIGGGEKAPDCQLREGSHIRLGWGRREAPLNAPAGLDGYSYAYRDMTGEKVHLSRLRPYGKSFKSGDVIGMYISLPSPRRQPDRKDPYDPARIKRERIAIEFKGQEYFESLEYAQSKEMIALMDARDRAKATNSSSMPSSATKKAATVKNLPSASRGKSTVQEPAPLRPLPTLGPDSHIAFFVNGECQGVAFRDLFDYLPLRNPANKQQEKKRTNKEGLREHKENSFDDGTLGYYPFISLFNGARVRINPGPDFEFMPPPDIDAVLSSSDAHDADIKPHEAMRTWRPMCERYPEFMAEQWTMDEVEFAEAVGTQQGTQKQPQTEQTGRSKTDEAKHQAYLAKRRAQAAARKHRKLQQAKEEAETKRRKLETDATPSGEAKSSPVDRPSAEPSVASPGKPALLDPSPYVGLGISIASPAPTVASSVDVHMTGPASRYDSSAYNSEYEDMDAEADTGGRDHDAAAIEMSLREPTYSYRERSSATPTP